MESLPGMSLKYRVSGCVSENATKGSFGRVGVAEMPAWQYPHCLPAFLGVWWGCSGWWDMLSMRSLL